MESAAGGVKGALLLFGSAVMNERPAVAVNSLGEDAKYGALAQGRSVMEIADDLPAEDPQIVDMAAHCLGSQAGRIHVLNEKTETGGEFLARRDIPFPTPSRSAASGPSHGNSGRRRRAPLPRGGWRGLS